MRLHSLLLSCGAAACVLGCGEDSQTSLGTPQDPSPLTSIALPGEDLYPDGIAVDDEGALFVGSLSSGSIFRVLDPTAPAPELFASGQLSRGALGMTISGEHSVLLVCDASPLDPSSSSLVALDLENGARIADHPMESVAEGTPVLCNDVALSENGDAFVTDTFGARVLRIGAADVSVDGRPLETWHDSEELAPIGEPAFGANGIAFVAGELYVANFNRGSLVHIGRDAEGRATSATTVELFDAQGLPTRLIGPDGIAATREGEILVVESGIFSPGEGNRLSVVTLEGNTGTVEPVLEGLDVPTTTAEGPTYTWVVQGQLDHLIQLDTSPPGSFEIIGVRR